MFTCSGYLFTSILLKDCLKWVCALIWYWYTVAVKTAGFTFFSHQSQLILFISLPVLCLSFNVYTMCYWSWEWGECVCVCVRLWWCWGQQPARLQQQLQSLTVTPRGTASLSVCNWKYYVVGTESQSVSSSPPTPRFAQLCSSLTSL